MAYQPTTKISDGTDQLLVNDDGSINVEQGAKGKSSSETQQEILNSILIELRLLNLHLHELPRALNDGYNYGEDDVSIRADLDDEL